MNKNISSLLSEADNSLMKSRLYQAFDLYVQAGSLALDEPELLLEVGVKFGKLGHQCYYHGNYQLAIDAYWIALMFIPEQFEDDQRVIEEYLEQIQISHRSGADGSGRLPTANGHAIRLDIGFHHRRCW